jgi:mono/diheme cytochrome c family protein
MMLMPISFRRLSVACGVLALVLTLRTTPGALALRETPSPGLKIDFRRQILPILADNCFACHGPDEKQRKSKLRLDTKEGAFGKLKSGGFAVVPGKPAASELVERITSAEPSEVMPPPKSGKQLTPELIALLKRWVEQGAPWSQHWAFVTPQKPALPRVSDPRWPRNPIDYFILARLDAEGLKPSSEADRTTLIRRVTLDLTGLPPTPREVDAFLADRSPLAYERLVDRLLESPRYGEHLGRYWLDAARYGDTHGLHLDNYREMWPYREWVIRAFNRNLPFDRFLIEQLAGDLLPDATLDQRIASGFNRCHVTTSEGGSIEEEVYVRNVVDRIDTSGVVLMGLTTGCCRCHDHKYDPITQKDYYQLFAIFNSLDEKALDGNAARYPPVIQVAPPEQLAELERKKQQVSWLRLQIAVEVSKVKDEAVAAALSPWLTKLKPAGLPKPLQAIAKLDPKKRSAAQQKQLRDHFIENVYAATRPTFDPLHRQLRQAEQARDRLDKAIPATLVSQELKEPRPAYILKRGEYDRRGAKVGRATPAFLPPLPADAPRNRLGFAQWLVSRSHPLTARVAVNRFWQHCFGTGLAKTAEDFGTQGEPPSHPDLLDWLAVQFQDDGWDVKKTLRRIVTSATYRQSSRATPGRLAKDPANRLLARGPRFRLDAEVLRDQALYASGLLVERLGGPSVKPPQPSGLWEAVGYVTSNTRNFTPDAGIDKVHRRSLYTFWKRTAPPPQMSAFDAPSREACTVRRERTDTPLQALVLLNETQYVECARALAERAMREAGPKAEERLVFLFRLAAARRPDAGELRELLAAYRAHLAEFSRDVDAAKKLIAVGESKPDTRLDPGQLAAWTMVGNLILNLDEVLNKG